jgi:carbonic anhydrase/acetyltransferase-like protein (isoleucine patch superfamily)
MMRRIGQVYLATTATVTADVVLGEDVSIWPGAVVRGDVAPIVIGRGSNIQDQAVVHCDYGQSNTIEEDVVVGHAAVLHGVRVGRGTLIGIGAKLLGGTIIGEECLIAAGAILPPGMIVPPRSVVMGLPGKIIRSVTSEEIRKTTEIAIRYRN